MAPMMRRCPRRKEIGAPPFYQLSRSHSAATRQIASAQNREWRLLRQPL